MSRAGFGIGRARVLRSEINITSLVGDHADLGIEAGLALGADIALKCGADFMLGLGPSSIDTSSSVSNSIE